MNSHRQKNCGRGIPSCPCGPQQYFPVSESVHQLPTGRSPTRARSPAALSRSQRSHSQTSQWLGGELASFYQGAQRSHGELPFRYDPLTFPYADAHTQRQQGGPHDLTRSREPLPYSTDPARVRDPRYRSAQCADRDHLTWPVYAVQSAAYASPWGHPVAPSPTWQHPTQLSPGFHWGSPQWDYALAAWQGGSPRPQPLAWEHANGSSRATTAGLPFAGNPTTVHNPSAYDTSAADGGPSDWHPRSRLRGKRHRRQALSSPDKRRRTSHTPVWRPSSSSSESEDTESRDTPPPEESGDSHNVDSTMRPLDPRTPSRSAMDLPLSARDLQLRSTPLPPRPIRTHASGHPPQETRKGSILFLGHRPDKELPQSREAGECRPRTGAKHPLPRPRPPRRVLSGPALAPLPPSGSTRGQGQLHFRQVHRRTDPQRFHTMANEAPAEVLSDLEAPLRSSLHSATGSQLTHPR